VDGKSVAVLRIDADSGALAHVAGSPFAVTTPVAFIAGEPSGRFLYMTEFGAAGVHAFALDGDAGSIAELDASPFARTEVFGGAVAPHPDGKIVYAGQLNSFAIGNDGTLTELPGSPPDASFHSDPNAFDLVVDPQGRHAYGIDSVSGAVAAFRIDADSGALTPAPGSPYDAGGFPYSVGVDPQGRFVYVPGDDGSGVSIFAVDPTSGALSPVPGSPFVFNALQPQIIVTPAP
jgi:6-phosphogluconolactonase